MTHTLDILQDYLELRRYSYERLDGSIRAQERSAAIRSFSQQSVKDDQNSGPNQNGAFVFMISTRAGGVIFFEQDWNPQVDKKALQRAHRIGQMSRVTMRRAQRKMLLSQNVIGDGSTEKGDESEVVETGDFRSIIYGLQMFDPTEINAKSGESKLSEVNAVVEKIIAMRHELGKDERKFEIDPANVTDTGELIVEGSSTSVAFDPGFDESSYHSWVEKFKDTSQASIEQNELLGPRRALEPEDRSLSIENAKKKAEEKKLLKDISSDSGSLHFVYGDCTQPSKVCPSENTIIFSCIDNSGKWGHGGMFNALAKLSSDIPAAYERAAKFGDLHLGCTADHEHEQNVRDDHTEWVALAVVQSYNPRRKAPRSNISLPDLESCLSKASYSAAQNSASIHMPCVGYQDGSDRSEWYTVERLLRKYAAIFGIKIFVSYWRQSPDDGGQQIWCPGLACGRALLILRMFMLSKNRASDDGPGWSVNVPDAVESPIHCLGLALLSNRRAQGVPFWL
ncbi:hypothetical protein ACJRO7_018021 [Eucalyptus globulus]|uniref:Helicase C-terminal domain-containing protein n=1 Tax=Eucalyptus globulus TaxID=34317 RepID=A0ABD3KTG2_EUCGL